MAQANEPASAAKVPAEQLKQEVLPEAAAKVPIKQLSQTSAPDESEYLPTPQTRQSLLETYLPAAHTVVGVTHALAPAADVMPEGQGGQTEEPAAEA